LTCDLLVTYGLGVGEDERVFRALADASRRFLLDLLFERDGRTLTELESELAMTRFGVMKHLKVLEEAGLVVTRRAGREKLHFLNAVPIRLVHDRWIDKYTEPQVAALVDLKAELEDDMSATTTYSTVQVHRVYIKATPERIWTALTEADWAEKYGYQCRIAYELREGGTYKAFANAAMGNEGDVILKGEVVAVEPPRRLVQTWDPVWIDEPATRLTYEIAEGPNGVCSLTLTHDLADAPLTADQVAGRLENAGGGWPQVLSDLKTLLETGSSLYA